jgi:hypothetical protein
MKKFTLAGEKGFEIACVLEPFGDIRNLALESAHPQAHNRSDILRFFFSSF